MMSGWLVAGRRSATSLAILQQCRLDSCPAHPLTTEVDVVRYSGIFRVTDGIPRPASSAPAFLWNIGSVRHSSAGKRIGLTFVDAIPGSAWPQAASLRARTVPAGALSVSEPGRLCQDGPSNLLPGTVFIIGPRRSNSGHELVASPSCRQPLLCPILRQSQEGLVAPERRVAPQKGVKATRDGAGTTPPFLVAAATSMGFANMGCSRDRRRGKIPPVAFSPFADRHTGLLRPGSQDQVGNAARRLELPQGRYRTSTLKPRPFAGFDPPPARLGVRPNGLGH